MYLLQYTYISTQTKIMDRKLNKRIADYIVDFKKSIKEKAISLDFTEEQKLHDLLEHIYSYDRLVLSQEDVSKRKRVKNTIPNTNRCHAKRANGEQCTRKQKEGHVYCGTHVKGTPHGMINNDTENEEPYVVKEVIAEEINGIVYYLDKKGHIFSTEDVLKGNPDPKVVAYYKKNNDDYIIEEIPIET
jgi:hypothetical protein